MLYAMHPTFMKSTPGMSSPKKIPKTYANTFSELICGLIFLGVLAILETKAEMLYNSSDTLVFFQLEILLGDNKGTLNVGEYQSRIN
jgi:cellobiose-specific phosphotransferase system component IIC